MRKTKHWRVVLKEKFLYNGKIDPDIFRELLKIIQNLLAECRKEVIKRMKEKFQKQGKLL